jgi:hypothetical protein
VIRKTDEVLAHSLGKGACRIVQEEEPRMLILEDDGLGNSIENDFKPIVEAQWPVRCPQLRVCHGASMTHVG